MTDNHWKKKPATPMQMAFVKALSDRDADQLTKGKATSIVRNKINKIRKKAKKRANQGKTLSDRHKS